MDNYRTLRHDLDKATAAIRQLANTATNQAANIAQLAAGLVAVNAKTQRAGASLGPLPVGSIDITITWPNPWPDPAYAVIPIIQSGTGALGSLAATLKAGTKTVNDCVVTIANTGSVTIAALGLDVIGVRT